MKHLLATTTIMFLTSVLFIVNAQQVDIAASSEAKTTPAYSALVIRKAALEAELDQLLKQSTEEWAATRSKRFEFAALVREMKQISALPKSSIPKLTIGYATLILRKASLESSLESLLLENTAEVPEVKRAESELAALSREIKAIIE